MPVSAPHNERRQLSPRARFWITLTPQIPVEQIHTYDKELPGTYLAYLPDDGYLLSLHDDDIAAHCLNSFHEQYAIKILDDFLIEVCTSEGVCTPNDDLASEPEFSIDFSFEVDDSDASNFVSMPVQNTEPTAITLTQLFYMLDDIVQIIPGGKPQMGMDSQILQFKEEMYSIELSNRTPEDLWDEVIAIEAHPVPVNEPFAASPGKLSSKDFVFSNSTNIASFEEFCQICQNLATATQIRAGVLTADLLVQFHTAQMTPLQVLSSLKSNPDNSFSFDTYCFSPEPESAIEMVRENKFPCAMLTATWMPLEDIPVHYGLFNVVLLDGDCAPVNYYCAALSIDDAENEAIDHHRDLTIDHTEELDIDDYPLPITLYKISVSRPVPIVHYSDEHGGEATISYASMQ